MIKVINILAFFGLTMITLMGCSNNSGKTVDKLIIGKWVGSYDKNEVRLEFTDKSNLIIEYVKTGSQLSENYTVKGDTLYVDGEKHSILRTLNEKELRLRPLTTEIREDIDILHTITFRRLTTQQKSE